MRGKCECEWDSFLLFIVCAVFAVVDNWIGITTCLEQLAHFLCFSRKICAVATKTSQSKELRVRDGVLDVCWVG